MELTKHLNKHYMHVTKCIGGVEDTIESHQNNVKMFNERVLSSLQTDIKGLELIVLYDNTKFSDRYKNRVFDFYVICDLEEVDGNIFKMSQLRNISENLSNIMKGIA